MKAENAFLGGRLLLVATICLLACFGASAADMVKDNKPAEASAAPADTSQAQPTEATQTKDSEATKTKSVSGSFESELDTAWSDHDSDVNLDQTLRLNVDPPNYKNIHIKSLFWMQEDLDSDESRTSGLRDVNDAYDSDVRFRPLYLYMQVDDLWGKSTLRLGRQRIDEGAAWNRIDGLYFKKTMPTWDWYAFGGARASVYIDSHHDPVAGGGVSFRPFDGTRIALDGYYGREQDREHGGDLDDIRWPWAWASWFHINSPRDIDDDRDDSRIALSAWQSLGPNLMLYGQVAEEDGKAHSGILSATGNIPQWQVSYELTYRGQFDTTNDRVYDLGGFYQTLGTYEKYQDVLLAVHRPLTNKITLSLESEFHNADDTSEYADNYDYQRYAAILSAEKLWGGLGASLSLEHWNADRGKGMTTVSAEVSKDWGKVSAALGTDFNRYEDTIIYHPASFWLDQIRPGSLVSVFQLADTVRYLNDGTGIETHENVRSVFGKVKWNFRDNQDLNARVTYETDDEPDSPYWRVQAGYAIRF